MYVLGVLSALAMQVGAPGTSSPDKHGYAKSTPSQIKTHLDMLRTKTSVTTKSFISGRETSPDKRSVI